MQVDSTAENAGVSIPKALVTGASSGIGRVFAQALAQRGYRVTCVARDEAKLRQLTESLGEGHRVLAADLTVADRLAAVAEHISQNHYDLLVNNAGQGVYHRFEKTAFEAHAGLVALNITALMRLSYAFLQGARQGDALINVSSVVSRLPYPGSAVYSGTKAFVTNLTESLWYEFKERGVYVLALLPGPTDTDFHRVAMGGRPVPEYPFAFDPPERVVADALQALAARRKPSLISGPKIRFMANLASRFLPRKMMIEIMGRQSLRAS